MDWLVPTETDLLIIQYKNFFFLHTYLKENIGNGVISILHTKITSYNIVHRFTEFGGPVPYRPAEDLAFSVAKFIQKGGSYINYYMVNRLFSQICRLYIFDD